ncbi:MAG: 3-deoxy-7-phosphoheptulonate synthase [Fimbriimonadaceae bacterium]|nr:3-deoxy-7-phosphoheptulonate synthase [Fimbriimonadaceae bacterium]
MRYQTDDTRILAQAELTAPEHLIRVFEATPDIQRFVSEERKAIARVISGEDDRLLVVVGPCSIHDVRAGFDFARLLKGMRDELAEDLQIVMRVYFEKPRTTVGWKGLINDPDLDGSFNINKGVRMARQLLLEINELGVPTGSEFLDTISPQYIADLVGWGAIGARTTESQVHRELASGLSCPVGFKNGTDGNIDVAADAVLAASVPHAFLSVTKQGQSAIFSTAGNPDTHVILRGGHQPNYDADSVEAACSALRSRGLNDRVMVDASHANSGKDFRRQPLVAADLAERIAAGDDRLMGIMLESHIHPGRQNLVPGKELLYGTSVTDGCLGWHETVPVLQRLAAAVRDRRKANAKPKAN